MSDRRAGAAILLATALFAACRGPRPDTPPAAVPAPLHLAEGASRSFDVTIAPGTWYTFNFVSIVSSAHPTSEAAADFSTTGQANLVAAAFAHPRAELSATPQEGKVRVHVRCPGIENHPVKGAAVKSSRSASLVTRTDEVGYFGFAFRSEAAEATDLHVTLRAVHSGLMLMFVGPVKRDAIEIQPHPAGNGTQALWLAPPMPSRYA